MTSASHLYASNVPEQMIKEIIGHCSDCVRVYKRTTDEIRQHASCIIGGECNVGTASTAIENVTLYQEALLNKFDVVLGEVSSLMDEMLTCSVNEVEKPRLKCQLAHFGSPGSLSLCQMIHNVAKTKAELHGLKAKKLALKCLTDTSKFITLDINVNVNVKK